MVSREPTGRREPRPEQRRKNTACQPSHCPQNLRLREQAPDRLQWRRPVREIGGVVKDGFESSLSDRLGPYGKLDI